MSTVTRQEVEELFETLDEGRFREPNDHQMEHPDVLEGRTRLEQRASETVPDFIDTYRRYADVLEIPGDAHEAIAIALAASAANSRVWIKAGDKRLSLDCWTLIITPSGGGRNTTVSKARQILKLAKLEALLHNVQWGSEAAVKQDFAENSCGLFIWPEMSEVLQDLNRPHFAGVKQWITNLYDETAPPPSKVYRKVEGKKGTPPIEFLVPPRASFVGTSSYEWLIQNLSRVDASGGFLARWMITFLPDIKKRIPIPPESDSSLLEPLAARLKQISSQEGTADLSRVLDMYEAWYIETADRFDKHPNRSLATAFWNRHRDHLLKLAVIFELSKSGTLRVTVASMKRAIYYASKLERGLLQLLETGLDGESYELGRMIDFVRQGGCDGVLASELTNAFKNMDGRLRYSRTRTLLDGGDFCAFTRKTPGRPATVFVHKDYVPEYKKTHPDDGEPNL